VHALIETAGQPDPSTVIAQAPPGTTYESGARVGITVAPGKTFLFDAETGSADLSRDRVATA
jgi:sn-glycerol 3-phosphate transport system ATP-binding protein